MELFNDFVVVQRGEETYCLFVLVIASKGIRGNLLWRIFGEQDTLDIVVVPHLPSPPCILYDRSCNFFTEVGLPSDTFELLVEVEGRKTGIHRARGIRGFGGGDLWRFVCYALLTGGGVVAYRVVFCGRRPKGRRHSFTIVAFDLFA